MTPCVPQLRQTIEPGFSAEPPSTWGRPIPRLARPSLSTPIPGARSSAKALFLPQRRAPGWDGPAAVVTLGACPLPHPLPDTAQMVRLPRGHDPQQQPLVVMLGRPLQLDCLLGGSLAADPPVPKPGPEAA